MKFLEIVSMIGGSLITLFFTFAFTLVLGVIIYALFSELLRKILKVKEVKKPEDRMAESLHRIRATSERFTRDISFVMAEISKREEFLINREKKYKSLSEEEKRLRKSVNKLKKTPIGAVEYFKSIIESSDRKSRRRNLVIFALGMLVNYLIGAFGLTSLLNNIIKSLFGL